MGSEKVNRYTTDAVANFKSSPQSVKNGFTVLVLAWAWHFITLYSFFLHGQIPGNQIVIGLLVCLFVFLIKNWARVLCVVCNILIICMYLFVGASFYTTGEIFFGLIALMNVALFSLATYFLMMGSSAAYYKSKMPRKKDSSAEGAGENKD